MAFSLCIERAAEFISTDLIQSLFDKAFNPNSDRPFVQHIVEHSRTDPISKINFKTFFIYFKRSTKRLDIFRQIILHNGIAEFSFASRFNHFTLLNEFVIVHNRFTFIPDSLHTIHTILITQ